jgi:hypothetical protein
MSPFLRLKTGSRSWLLTRIASVTVIILVVGILAIRLSNAAHKAKADSGSGSSGGYNYNYGVNAGSGTDTVTFTPSGWSAAYVILHYNVSDGAQGMNVNMSNGSGTWTYAVSGVTSSSTLSYSFTFSPGGGVQYDTATYTTSASGANSPSLVGSGWTQCASENQNCSFSGIASVAYGANGVFAYGSFTNGTACSNGVFGDPDNGVVKACFVSTSYLLPTTGGIWVNCASENQNCSFSGTMEVAYGGSGSNLGGHGYYLYRNATNGIACNNGVFGDPDVGVVKNCFVQTSNAFPVPPALTDSNLNTFLNAHVTMEAGAGTPTDSNNRPYFQQYVQLLGGDTFISKILTKVPNFMIEVTSSYSGVAASSGDYTYYNLDFWNNNPDRRVPTLLHETVHHINNGEVVRNLWQTASTTPSMQWDSYPMTNPAEYIACGTEWLITNYAHSSTQTNRARLQAMDPNFYNWLVGTFIPQTLYGSTAY